MGRLSVKKSNGDGNCNSFLLSLQVYWVLCLPYCVLPWMLNCFYTQVISLISNGVHEIKGTYFNVT